jgi:hypothetical protein
LEILQRFKSVESLPELDKKLLFLLFQGIDLEHITKQFNHSPEYIESRILGLLKRYGYATTQGLVADYSLYLMQGYWDKLAPIDEASNDEWKSRSAIIGMTAWKEREIRRGELELSLKKQ